MKSIRFVLFFLFWLPLLHPAKKFNFAFLKRLNKEHGQMRYQLCATSKNKNNAV
jgi:hypothetical protein